MLFLFKSERTHKVNSGQSEESREGKKNEVTLLTLYAFIYWIAFIDLRYFHNLKK